MNDAIYFKALQRKLKFRNPNSIISIDSILKIDPPLLSQRDLQDAENYIKQIEQKNISYVYPGHSYYPQAFYRMLEPPLFLEYLGYPCWMNNKTLSVVGARKIDILSQKWMQTELIEFLQLKKDIILVSGGAIGVDQMAHIISLKINRPTIAVVPSGLEKIYPDRLVEIKNEIIKCGGCLLSEFELRQDIRKNYFYFRNRIIAGFSDITLVVQAEKKSGSFLTVHHALQNGKTILTVPAHPMMSSFSGNQHLMKEGAFFVSDRHALLDFWEAESWSGPV